MEDYWISLQGKFPILENYQVKQSYKLFGPPMATTKNSLDHNIYSFLDILLGHMQTVIWNTYCSKIHSNVDYDAYTIIKTFDNNIKKSLHVFLFAMKQPAYTPSRWACPRLSQEKAFHKTAYSPWREVFTSMIEQWIPNEEQSISKENDRTRVPPEPESDRPKTSKKTHDMTQTPTQTTGEGENSGKDVTPRRKKARPPSPERPDSSRQKRPRVTSDQDKKENRGQNDDPQKEACSDMDNRNNKHNGDEARRSRPPDDALR